MQCEQESGGQRNVVEKSVPYVLIEAQAPVEECGHKHEHDEQFARERLPEFLSKERS